MYPLLQFLCRYWCLPLSWYLTEVIDPCTDWISIDQLLFCQFLITHTEILQFILKSCIHIWSPVVCCALYLFRFFKTFALLLKCNLKRDTNKNNDVNDDDDDNCNNNDDFQQKHLTSKLVSADTQFQINCNEIWPWKKVDGCISVGWMYTWVFSGYSSFPTIKKQKNKKTKNSLY